VAVRSNGRLRLSSCQAWSCWDSDC